MKKLTICLCFILLSMAAFYSPAHASFIYDISNYEQHNGTNTFTDSFSDGDEPPSGPISGSDYHVEGLFASNRENGGVLELNSDDALTDYDEKIIAVGVQNSNYFFSSGIAGQYATGAFEVNDGFFSDSFFGIAILNTPSDGSDPDDDDEAWMGIYRGHAGNFTYATWGDENNDYYQDITSVLGTNTAITMKLLINDSNQVTAMFDYGSDGVDLTNSNFTTLSFIPDNIYTGGFEAGEPIPEPTTLLLLGSGLLGIAMRKKRRK